ncbi:hypothetical protein QVD17_27931 [Tagetes erecta]|uniref:S-protein homolog n=1 Tax=Tagetes erecta TaxID=13708 RepID=A0AAD8K9X4_TARER|nr:hypothetical protein QVD17_27931 [Tagetes erecta]
MNFLSKLYFCVFLLLLHLCSILNANTPPASSKWLEPFRITITNQDVPNVVVKCNDLEATMLKPGNSTSWKFRRNFWNSNKYSCRFFWVEDNMLDVHKVADFSVFDVDIVELCGNYLFTMNRCYWYVTRDGFYFCKNNDNINDWNKMHEWTNI